jgi:hypothetical protein
LQHSSCENRAERILGITEYLYMAKKAKKSKVATKAKTAAVKKSKPVTKKQGPFLGVPGLARPSDKDDGGIPAFLKRDKSNKSSITKPLTKEQQAHVQAVIDRAKANGLKQSLNANAATPKVKTGPGSTAAGLKHTPPQSLGVKDKLLAKLNNSNKPNGKPPAPVATARGNGLPSGTQLTGKTIKVGMEVKCRNMDDRDLIDPQVYTILPPNVGDPDGFYAIAKNGRDLGLCVRIADIVKA